MRTKKLKWANSETVGPFPVSFEFYLFTFPDAVNSLSLMENSVMDQQLLDDIISTLDPELVPWIYIDLAFVTGLDGIEKEVTGSELLSILNDPSVEKSTLNVQVLMDRKRLKNDIGHAIDSFWSEVLDTERPDDDDNET